MRHHEFATHAALGTSRRAFAPTMLPAEIVATLPTPDAAPPLVWLDAAASWASARAARVADGPHQTLDFPPPSRPEIPAPAAAVLRQLGGGEAGYRMQAEALTLIAEHGMTLPIDLLLELLRGLQRPRGIPAALIGGVLDDRGWALAQLNPVWAQRLGRASGTGQPPDHTLWDEGTLSERRDFLIALREVDPDAARALLTDLAWSKETAEVRETFVRTLTAGLSADDEPLLEARLDDRAASVRAAASELLAALPSSALVARAEVLVAAHLSLRPRVLRSPALVATGVPADAATTRDGYPSDAASSTGDLGRLGHALSLVPTDRWPALLGATASVLASSPVECDGMTFSLRPFWGRAAARSRDAALARTLLATPDEHQDHYVHQLGPVLPQAELAELLATRWRGTPAVYTRDQGLLPDRMDAGATAAVASVAETWLTRPTPPPRQTFDLVERLSTGAQPASAARVAAMLRALAERPKMDSNLRRALLAGSARLQLRVAMTDALTSALAAPPSPNQEGQP